MSESNFSFSLAAAPVTQDFLKGKADLVAQHIKDFSIPNKKDSSLVFLFSKISDNKVKAFFKKNETEISQMIQDGKVKISENNLQQYEAITGKKIAAVKMSVAQKSDNLVEGNLVADFDKIYSSLNKAERITIRKGIKNSDSSDAVELLVKKGMRQDEAEKMISFLKSKEGRIHIKDLREAERVKRALENLKSEGLISDDLYKSVNTDIDKQIQIFKNESNFLKLNRPANEESAALESDTSKNLISDNVSKATLANIKEHQSYQIIVDLLKAAKMTMEEFLKSVEKSKDFADSLKN